MVRSQFLLGLKIPEGSPARWGLTDSGQFEGSSGADLALEGSCVTACSDLDFDCWGNSSVLV
jgi:hypothetical protein